MRLKELAPEWFRATPKGGRLGFDFLCPEHNGKGHRVRVFFSRPPDGDQPVTSSESVRTVSHTGEDFDTLSVGATIRDGETIIDYLIKIVPTFLGRVLQDSQFQIP